MSAKNTTGIWAEIKKRVTIFLAAVAGILTGYAVYTSFGLPNRYDFFGVILMIVFMTVTIYSACRIFGWEFIRG
ncbi:Photosystem II reaction center N protein (psbN) [Halostagnicola kamekurae]|uniref:Photosystem II reaction center N protein (PsbN) n=1 Tax=Halostagnicola kamekurae TaxID=619731 RepID=A0A1I6TU67_9EURY|nr:Photosystem II reaction center N protein (psbN) [Halostagnicola kamekurae]